MGLGSNIACLYTEQYIYYAVVQACAVVHNCAVVQLCRVGGPSWQMSTWHRCKYYWTTDQWQWSSSSIAGHMTWYVVGSIVWINHQTKMTDLQSNGEETTKEIGSSLAVFKHLSGTLCNTVPVTRCTIEMDTVWLHSAQVTGDSTTWCGQ